VQRRTAGVSARRRRRVASAPPPRRPPSARPRRTSAAAPRSASAGKVPTRVCGRPSIFRDVPTGTVGVAAASCGGGNGLCVGSGLAAGDGGAHGGGWRGSRGGGARLEGDDKQPSCAGESSEQVHGPESGGERERVGEWGLGRWGRGGGTRWAQLKRLRRRPRPQKATAAEGHGRRRPRPQKATAAEGHGRRRPRRLIRHPSAMLDSQIRAA